MSPCAVANIIANDANSTQTNIDTTTITNISININTNAIINKKYLNCTEAFLKRNL